MAERQIPSFDATTGQVWVCTYEPYEKRIRETPLTNYVDKTEGGQRPEYRFGACKDHEATEALLQIPPLTEAERLAELIAGFPQNVRQ